MTTKYQGMHLKDKQDVDLNVSTDVYSNFTLNKSHKCTSTAFDQKGSKTLEIGNRKNSNYDMTAVSTEASDFTEKTTPKKDIFSLKKPHKTSSKDYFNTNFNEANGEKIIFSSCNKSSSSTLSLHIAAYESFVEGQVTDFLADKELKKKDTITTASKTLVQQSTGSPSFNDLLEFPRQQENKATTPEIQQFATSQKLFTPIQESFAPRVTTQPMVAQNKKELILAAKVMQSNRMACVSSDIPSSRIKPPLSLNALTPVPSVELPFQRPPSPWLELNPDAAKDASEPSALQLINRREKIHRIHAVRIFPAEITYVISPSEIWVRLPTHIADNLTISTNNAPQRETNIAEGIYVFTPLDEYTLVRARIVIHDSEKKLVLLRFIDHGKLVWRDENAIFEMKSERDEMRKYPWQAFPIILQDVFPANGVEWTDSEVDALQNALSDFPMHYVLPSCHELLYINDDNSYVRASIQAMTDRDFQRVSRNVSEVEESGYSVAELYRNYLGAFLPSPEPKWDYFEQKSYRYRNALCDTFDLDYERFAIEPSLLPESKNELEGTAEKNKESLKSGAENDEDGVDAEQWDDVEVLSY